VGFLQQCRRTQFRMAHKRVAPLMVAVVDIFQPPSRSPHVSRDSRVLWEIDSYSIKTNPYLHMGVGYIPRMKESVTPLKWRRWLWIDADFPTWDPHQSWRLRRSCTFKSYGYKPSMMFASTTSPNKNINISSFPSRGGGKRVTLSTVIITHSATTVILLL